MTLEPCEKTVLCLSDIAYATTFAYDLVHKLLVWQFTLVKGLYSLL